MTNDITRNGDTREDDSVLRAVRRLPQEVDPRRDLWPGIEAGINRPWSGIERSPRTWVYAIAAGLGCMALGGLVTFAVMNRAPQTSTPQTTIAAQQPGPTPSNVTSTELAPRVIGAKFGGYAALGPEYERARASLEIALVERLDRLPPAERQKVERNLTEIRRSLREINTALALQPNSTLLQDLLLSTYQHELAILADVNQMAGSFPARAES